MSKWIEQKVEFAEQRLGSTSLPCRSAIDTMNNTVLVEKTGKEGSHLEKQVAEGVGIKSMKPGFPS